MVCSIYIAIYIYLVLKFCCFYFRYSDYSVRDYFSSLQLVVGDKFENFVFFSVSVGQAIDENLPPTKTSPSIRGLCKHVLYIVATCNGCMKICTMNIRKYIFEHNILKLESSLLKSQEKMI